MLILGKDSKVKDDKPLEVVDAYILENSMELIDPLDSQKKMQKLQSRIDTLMTELDTQIKVLINASQFVYSVLNPEYY